MGIKIRSYKTKNSVRIDGNLTIYEVAEYKKAFKNKCSPDKKMELDLSKVDEIDTSGLQLLAVMGKQILKKGAEVQFGGMSEVASEALELSGLKDVFHVE